MKPAVSRLVLTAALFAGWLGYLGYLVATRPLVAGYPLVVSRPQILTSEIDIIADIKGPDGPIEVVEVLWPEKGAALAKGDTIRIARIEECKPLRQSQKDRPPPPDFAGPGRYLVPLRALRKTDDREGIDDKVQWTVAPVPPSPGFPHGPASPVYRIYPATPEALAQYRQVVKPD